MAVDDEAATRRRLLVTVIALLITQFVAMTNSTIVVTAIPAILDELGGVAAQGSWIISGTMLGVTISTPIWGRLSDRHDPLRLLDIALVGIAVTAIASSFSTDTLHIILIRAVQGLCIGGVFSLTMIVLARIVTPRERGKYMGWMSAANLVSTLVAPLLGGLIVESPLGWRGSFYGAVPFIVAVLVLMRFTQPIERLSDDRRRIDYPGALLLALGLLGLQLWISFVGKAFDPVALVSLLLIGGAVVVLAVALVVEWRAELPILPLRLLGSRVIALVAIAGLMMGMSQIPVVILMNMYLQTGRGISPALSGLLLVTAAVGTALAALVVGVRTGRTGYLKRYLVVGAVSQLCGLLLLTLIGPSAPLPLIVVVLLLIGAGQGATTQFLMLAAQNAVGLGDVGAVSGFMAFLSVLGGSTALATTSALLTSRIDGLMADGATEAAAYAQGVPEAFVFCVATAGIGLVAILLLPVIRLRRTMDIEDAEDATGAAAQ